MHVIKLSAATVLFMAGTVHAQSQLALTHGVNEERHSIVEVARLHFASGSDNGRSVDRAIRSKQRIGVLTTRSEPSAGRINLAHALKVNPRRMNASQLYGYAQVASRSGVTPEWYLDKVDRDHPRHDPTTVTRGEIQLARKLGVDPRDYTVAQLADMALPSN